MPVKIFVAHPKGFEELAEYVAKLQAFLNKGATDIIELTTGHDDYCKNFARYGGWDSWMSSVVAGNEYQHGLLVPRFNAIIVGPSPHVGKATATIVSKAIYAKKDVYHYNGDTSIVRVNGVFETDSTDFTSGWSIH